jgi:hypothetical protein
MSFIPPIGAATSSTRGLVKLAGDLAGTADTPTVPGLSAKLDSSEKGAVNGVATLDSGGKLTSAQVTFPVTSVASKTGDVALTKSDVGLTNVDNTSDADKPISSATQTALNAKASSVHTHAIADVTNLQSTLDAKADAAATTTALAGKAAVSHTHTASQISDSTTVGRAVLTATDAAAAQSALAIANTVQVVNAFTDVTTPVYGTLYVVRA